MNERKNEQIDEYLWALLSVQYLAASSSGISVNWIKIKLFELINY